MNQIYWLTDKYTSNLNISLQLSIYQSFQWRTVKYHFNYTSIYLWIREKLKLIQLWTKFIERLTNTLRIWTFHCNCLYISHFNEELSNIIVAELQIISGISEIWINAIYAPNLLSVWQIHFEFEHFIATALYQSSNEGVPYVIATKHQVISKLSGNVFIVMYST